MTVRRRALGVTAATAALILGVQAAAWADVNYLLSGNGRMTYSTQSNVLTLEDLKTGDNIYVNYKFVNDVCGTTTSACAPTNPGTIRRDSANPGTSTYTLNPTAAYLVIRLCNDDSPPDTCSEWKRSNA